jgi:beta-lactam-binding protein with PASTA domain
MLIEHGRRNWVVETLAQAGHPSLTGGMTLMRTSLYKYVVIALSIVSVLAAGGCASTAVKDMVQAPAFVGLSLRDAEAKAADAGLQIEVQSSETSKTMPVDFVLRQDAEPETMVHKRRVIGVVTSSGPVSLTLPDFVGGKFEDAQTSITKNQLILGDLIEKVDASAVGTVLAQDPPAGSEVNQNTVVKLTISRGIMATMPDLVGLSLTEAKKRLSSSGLAVSKVIVRPQTTQPAQLVLKQEPAAGDAIEKGGWIELSVSKVP